MGAYSTKYIVRKQAEDMVRRCRLRNIPDEVSRLSDKELDKELNGYAYAEEYQDIVGFLYNYIISENAEEKNKEMGY